MLTSLDETTPADPGLSVTPPPAPASQTDQPQPAAVQPGSSGFGDFVAPPPIQTMRTPQPGEQPSPKPMEKEAAPKSEEVS